LDATLDRLFASSVDVLLYDKVLGDGKKLQAMVCLGLARRRLPITRQSLATARAEVAQAHQDGREDRLKDLLCLEDRLDWWDELRRRFVTAKALKAIKLKGEDLLEETTFQAGFSRHANLVLRIASILAAHEGPPEELGKGSYEEYRFQQVDKDCFSQVDEEGPYFAIRSWRDVPAEKGPDKDLDRARAVRKATWKEEPIPDPNGSVRPPSPDDFCPHQEAFLAEHRRTARVVVDDHPWHLFYLLFRVQRFKKAKFAIQVVASDCVSPSKPDDEAMRDVSLWSVFGETDLILRFRATGLEAAMKIQERFQERLDKGKTLDRDERPNPLLIATEEEWINGQYVTSRPNNNFTNSYKYHTINQKLVGLRSIKYFILIRYKDTSPRAREHGSLVRGIIDLAPELTTIVESICPAKNPSEEEQPWLMIEGQVPCGMFPRLRELSRELEDEVSEGQGGSKETFIAYDLKGFPHPQDIGP
jgi:hypothetical protein